LGLPAVAALVLFAAPARAQDKPFYSWGDLRWIGSYLTDFPVDAAGTSIDQTAWLDQRVRLGGGSEFTLWGWGTEWDVLTGQAAGDTWGIPGDVDARDRQAHTAFTADGIIPRRLSAHGTTGNFQVEAGLMPSHWGLGVLANDGAHDPVFGRTDFGDRVIRLRATHMPNRAGPPHRTTPVLTAAVDLVVDDGTARLDHNEIAVNGILSGLLLAQDGGRYGFYGVFRQQWDRDPGRTMTVGVLDGYADAPLSLSGGWTARLAAEGVALVGWTDRATSYDAREGVNIAQFGAAGVASITTPDERFGGELWAGYASADGNPDDKWQHDFAFDPDFGAGAVLFDQVLGGVDAATYVLLTDPEIAAQPPDGVEALVREGAFHGATFVQPVLRARPMPYLDLRAGTTLTWANAPMSHPYYTYRAGGTPYNYHDLPSEGRLLGTEIDWSLGVGDEVGPATPSFTVQGGHLYLGRPLRGDGPDWVNHVMAVARVRW